MKADFVYKCKMCTKKFKSPAGDLEWAIRALHAAIRSEKFSGGPQTILTHICDKQGSRIGVAEIIGLEEEDETTDDGAN